MSDMFDRRPEYMILIAVLVALVLGIIGSVASCGMIASAASSAAQNNGQYRGAPIDDYGGLNGGNGGNGSVDSLFERSYTEGDVPESMVIDVPELQDDLEALINYDVKSVTKRQDKDVTVTELTKDEVGKPELRNGQVLSQVKGKATIKNSDGETGTVDYTSYYYADDPTADKVTWYIYAYDLGSYDLLPSGFKEKSGDPLGIRDYLQKGDGKEAEKTELGQDQGKDAQPV